MVVDGHRVLSAHHVSHKEVLTAALELQVMPVEGHEVLLADHVTGRCMTEGKRVRGGQFGWVSGWKGGGGCVGRWKGEKVDGLGGWGRRKGEREGGMGVREGGMGVRESGMGVSEGGTEAGEEGGR